jgi:hypothetical protein
MKKLKSPGDRLILIICRHRPAATKREIARAHLTGADLDQAKRETVGLVEFEPIHRKGSHKRSQAARLTQRGIWQAIRLTSGYDPALASAALAAIDIKAVLARLEAERNPLAVELAGYRHDAEAYRAQQKRSEALERKAWEMIEKVQEILSRPRHKLNPRHYARLEKFLESRGLKPLSSKPAVGQAQPIPGRIAGRSDVSPAPITVPCRPEPSVTLAPLPLTPQEEYIKTLAFQSRVLEERERKKYNPPDERVAIIARANVAGYPTRGGREVMYESRWIPCEEWNRLVPEN